MIHERPKWRAVGRFTEEGAIEFLKLMAFEEGVPDGPNGVRLHFAYNEVADYFRWTHRRMREFLQQLVEDGVFVAIETAPSRGTDIWFRPEDLEALSDE